MGSIQARPVSIRRHAMYNMAGSMAPLTVTFVTVPLYLGLIGDERFGILALAWALLGYFSVFDFGLSRATAQRIASLADTEPQQRSDVFWTALLLNAGFGIVGGCALLPLGYGLFSGYLNLSDGLIPEALATVPWLAAAVPVATVSAVFAGALQGRERFFQLNLTGIAGTVLSQLLPLFVAWLHGPDLGWILPAALVGRLLSLLLLLAYCRRHVPLRRPRIRKALIAPLFIYGGWVTVSGVISPLLAYMDRFMIAAAVGAKAVTYYVVPFTLVSRAAALPQALTSALFPRLACADSPAENDRLTAQAVDVLAVVMTPAIVAGMLLAQPFLTWWISEDFAAHAAPVAHVVALGLWANAMAAVPYAKLQAGGRPDLVAKCHLVELVPYLAFLAWVLPAWGIAGAAIAWSARAMVDALLLFALSGHRPKAMSAILPIGALTLAAMAVCAFAPGSPYRWAIGVAALASSLSWALHMAPAFTTRPGFAR